MPRSVMIKNIIFGTVAFAAGVGVGVGVTVLVSNHKKQKETKKPLLTKDLQTAQTDDFKEVEEVPAPKEEKVVEPEAFVEISKEDLPVLQEKMLQIIEDEGYTAEDPAESEFPTDDDPETVKAKAFKKMHEQLEAYRKANEGKIELITEEEFSIDNDFPEDDYEREALYFFKGDKILTNEDNFELEPIEQYVGNLFDKSRFWTNDWKVMYVRNHPMQKKFVINAPCWEYHDVEQDRDVIEWTSRKDFFF